MDLFIIPFTCSFAAHIACLEAGLPHTLQYVDRKTKRLDDGRDYNAINPKGLVPALALPDNSVLSEATAVLQWIADRAPESQLAPPAGTRERYELLEWLNFVTTELHKKHIWMIFSTKTPPEVKDWARASVPQAFDYIARHLANRSFLLGDQFSVADTYLFWILFVAPHGGVSLEKWPSLEAYVARIQERPSVKLAISVEGPLYARQQRAA